MIDHDSAKRRTVLQRARLGGRAGVAGLAAAQSRPAGRDFAGQSLTALVYSGINENTWRKHFVPQFEAATGAKVVIDAAWTEGIAKLKTAPGTRRPSTS